MSIGRQRVWGRTPSQLRMTFEADELKGLLRPGSDIELVEIYPTLGGDHVRLESVRRANRDWLSRWEATIPRESMEILPTWREYTRKADRNARDSRGLAMTVAVEGEVAGAVTVGAVQHGAMMSGILGYWIAEKWGGYGITSLAVAAVIDLMILELGLHRIEVNVRPENGPSLGVCRRLALRREGYKPRYMSIDGQWADHVGFAVDAEDLAHRSLVESLAISRLP